MRAKAPWEAKARAQISIAASQCFEPMPVDPSSNFERGHRTTTVWDKIGIQIHIPQPKVEDLSKEKVGWEREGVSYRKSRDGYGDCSSDHANSYGALAAASPSTSECWHALLPDGPACRKRLQMIYSIVRYRMRIEPRETSEYRAQRNQGSFLSWPEAPQVQDERREATLIGKALQANRADLFLLESRACCSWSVRENK